MNDDIGIYDTDKLTRAQERRIWFHQPKTGAYVMSANHVSRWDQRKNVFEYLRKYKRVVHGARTPMPGGVFDILQGRMRAVITLMKFESQRNQPQPTARQQAALAYIKEALSHGS